MHVYIQIHISNIYTLYVCTHTQTCNIHIYNEFIVNVTLDTLTEVVFVRFYLHLQMRTTGTLVNDELWLTEGSPLHPPKWQNNKDGKTFCSSTTCFFRRREITLFHVLKEKWVFRVRALPLLFSTQGLPHSAKPHASPAGCETNTSWLQAKQGSPGNQTWGQPLKTCASLTPSVVWEMSQDVRGNVPCPSVAADRCRIRAYSWVTSGRHPSEFCTPEQWPWCGQRDTSPADSSLGLHRQWGHLRAAKCLFCSLVCTFNYNMFPSKVSENEDPSYHQDHKWTNGGQQRE